MPENEKEVKVSETKYGEIAITLAIAGLVFGILLYFLNETTYVVNWILSILSLSINPQNFIIAYHSFLMYSPLVIWIIALVLSVLQIYKKKTVFAIVALAISIIGIISFFLFMLPHMADFGYINFDV